MLRRSRTRGRCDIGRGGRNARHPILGTIYGGVAGVVIGGIVGVIYTPVVLAVLLLRHRRPASAYAPLHDLARTFSVLMTLVAVALGVIPVVAALAVSIRVLRDAMVAICRAWTYPWGVGSH